MDCYIEKLGKLWDGIAKIDKNLFYIYDPSTNKIQFSQKDKIDLEVLEKIINYIKDWKQENKI